MHQDPVEFYGIPFTERVLRDIHVDQIVPSLREYDEVYEELKKHETDNKEFFLVLARLPHKKQEECFKKIIDTLGDLGDELEHCKEGLLKGKDFQHFVEHIL